jgi:ATP-dependent RNA helicase DDX55/SPB4
MFLKFKIPKRKILKLHRKIKQEQRSDIYQRFLKQSCGILLTTDVSARGLDIPDIDWIIQFDPPQDSDQYVHRIGRTARAGKEGESMILLQKHEEPYVEFLKSRKVTVLPMELETQFDNLEIRQHCYGLMEKDKDLVDKSQNAFVSFIRYYKEHELKFIFSFNHLQIGLVANSFALFRLPRIKEILGKKITGFENQYKDLESIGYVEGRELLSILVALSRDPQIP